MVQLFVPRFTSESQASEIRIKTFRFRTDLDNRMSGNVTKVNHLKAKRVRIWKVDCITKYALFHLFYNDGSLFQ